MGDPIIIIAGDDNTAADDELPADVIEDVSDAAVEIAKIEAVRDIELATIHAETQEASDEKYLDARITALNTELEQCRHTIATQAAEITDLQAALSILSSPELPPTNPPEPERNEPTPESLTPPVAETPPEPPKRKQVHRWI